MTSWSADRAGRAIGQETSIYIAQMDRAIEVAEIQYPKEDGWCHM